MTNPTTDTDIDADVMPAETVGPLGSIDTTSVASAVLPARFPDAAQVGGPPRSRTPARALGLFLATTAESIAGTVLGVSAVKRV
jgi:hypothetical protein